MAQRTVSPTFAVQRSKQRGFFDHGWLRTYHSFSFADYHDPQYMQWGALRVLNDDVLAPGRGFDPHPHRDMEILTYVLSGELEHRDSAGHHGVVSAGGVQFMSAGTGIVHSEFNHSQSEPLHLLQMWVLPGVRGAKPSYGQESFSVSARLNRWLPVASKRDESAPVRLTQDASFFVTRLENDASLTYRFEPQRLGFLFVAQGTAQVDGGANGTETLEVGDAVRIADLQELKIRGQAEIVLWDIPAPAENSR